jgi:hypothetical protein
MTQDSGQQVMHAQGTDRNLARPAPDAHFDPVAGFLLEAALTGG